MLLLQQNENFRILSEQSAVIQKQNEQLLKQVEDLKEQLTILTQQRFGTRSEKNLQISGQLSFDLDNPNVFNEAEIFTENGFPKEPSIDETVPVKKPRPEGKRAVDLAGIKNTTESHYLNEDTLNETFPKGWHQLEDEVYKELKRIPTSYEVVEHYIGVYAGNGNDAKIIRGEAPKRLLNHSIPGSFCIYGKVCECSAPEPDFGRLWIRWHPYIPPGNGRLDDQAAQVLSGTRSPDDENRTLFIASDSL